MRIPIEAQPLDRIQNGVDVFSVFFFGVGVVKAHVAHAAVVASQTEIQTDAFGVAHMQVAVGLRRKACANFGGISCAFGMVRGIAG